MTRKKRGPATAYEFLGVPIPELLGADNLVEAGFDVSSSCVGWSLGIDKELINFGKFVFKSTAEIGEKLVAFEQWFRTFLQTYKPKRIIIEKPLSRKGNVTMRHNELMGIIRKVWREETGSEVLDSWFLPATTIKRLMNVTRGRNYDDNKRIMVEKVNDICGLRLRYHRTSKLQSDDDVADAIAVLMSYWRQSGRGDATAA